MRISPIEQPPTLFMRFVYWMSKRKLGKVITPIKTLYARKPGWLWVSQLFEHIQKTQLKLPKLDGFLYKAYVAHLNNCSFCEDIAQALALSKKLDIRKFKHFDEPDAPGIYTDAERTAFRYLEEANRTRNVSDETFAQMQQHFSEEAILEITWLLAVENYYNVLNKAFGITSDELCLLQ
ncbi:MAG: carboxymuconolactone decarboxylase family protein [Phaeodactylibacter sp.]|nr:carboxymuconolactone decarboxylase family protein [Phaeodactylibacter sp.]